MRRGKAAIALLGLGLVLMLNAMAACPALHELIHHDADKPDHECAVTLFAHGQVDSTVCDVVLLPPTGAVESTRYQPVTVFCPAIAGLPRGRAPPSVSSSQV